MEPRSFPIRIGARSRPLLRLFFGVTSERAFVEVSDQRMLARFGWWTFEVPIGGIASWRIEGPWHWITAIGVRRSVRHGDVSFAGSPRGGVRLDLRTPVKWTIFHVPVFYAGVEDLEGFAAALTEVGIAGMDARSA